MSITAAKKQEVIKSNQRNAQDTGSTEVQIAILSERIASLTEHLKEHKKDVHSRGGLLKLVSRRRRLMGYMKETNPQGYAALIAKLGIRG